MSKLVIFDVDHTLFSSVTKVHIKKKNQKTGKWERCYTFKNQSDFETRRLTDEERYDFSEMRDAALFEMTAVAIPEVTKKLKEIIEKNGKLGYETWQVAIITARSSLRDKEKFISVFEKEGIPITRSREERYDPSKCHIYRAGDMKDRPSNIAKRKIIQEKIRSNKGPAFESVDMYDDSKANLDEFLRTEVAGKRLKLRAFWIKDGNIIEYAHCINGHIEYK